jgi:hypothetical protein
MCTDQGFYKRIFLLSQKMDKKTTFLKTDYLSVTKGARLPAGTVASVWYTGSGAPSSSSGNDGDMYLDTATEDVYQKASGVWTLSTNIKGATGGDRIRRRCGCRVQGLSDGFCRPDSR